jgi:hypothetical protein
VIGDFAANSSMLARIARDITRWSEAVKKARIAIE